MCALKHTKEKASGNRIRRSPPLLSRHGMEHAATSNAWGVMAHIEYLYVEEMYHVHYCKLPCLTALCIPRKSQLPYLWYQSKPYQRRATP